MVSSLLVTVAVVVAHRGARGARRVRVRPFASRGSSVLSSCMLAGCCCPRRRSSSRCTSICAVGLTDTYWALILPQTAQSLAFGDLLDAQPVPSFPGEIIEAARLDGARDLRVLWQVVVPPSLAPIMTMCVLITMWTWNEFLMPLVLIVTEDRRTAPLGLAFFQGEHLTDYSLLAAAGVIVALPIVILYFALQKRFISGMLGGISSR